MSREPVWIFDLDNTLYPANSDFFDQIVDRMTVFVAGFLGTDTVSARTIQKSFLHRYGTSLSGLMKDYNMPAGPFLDYVHDVDLSFLAPDTALQSAIKALPGRKYIFTNGSRKHAENVGSYLGVYDLMDGAYGIDDVDYIPKPARAPYEKFCEAFNIDPTQAVMFEDSLRNLEVPKAMGMGTVFIALDVPQRKPAPWVDHMTNDLAGWLEAYKA